MAKKKLTPEQEKEIAMLRANNEMYERTKEEAKMFGTPESLKRIEFAQEDVKERLRILTSGTDEAEPQIKPSDAPNINGESIFSILEKNREEETKKTPGVRIIKTDEPTVETREKLEYGSEISNPTDTMYNNVDVNAQYDVISLPSNGQCYRNKIDKVPVAYLTAYDENIITSPNLYKDGMVVEYLLKNKVMNKDINVEELVTGDADAIILFLRATSYGVDFPVTVQDPQTGEQIETSIDLTKIKTKEFKLEGDENGWFAYTLPKSKMDVKFRYLTRRDENDLKLLSRLENEAMQSNDIKDASNTISMILKNDTVLDSKEKAVILDLSRKLNDWAKRMAEKKHVDFNKMITNRLEMQVMEINGNRDREYIRNMIYSMQAGDSLALRKYILENEPGMDFEVEIERPESLGGGSFKTFLEWNDTVFFNIA